MAPFWEIFWHFSGLPDHELFSCCFDHFFGDQVKIIHLENTLNLGTEPVNQPKIATSDANDRGNRFRIGKVIWLQLHSKLVPFLFQDKANFLCAEGTELMHKTDARIELWIARQPFLYSRHADEDESEAPSVIAVSHVLQSGHFEPVRLINNHEVGGDFRVSGLELFYLVNLNRFFNQGAEHMIEPLQFFIDGL